MKQPCRGCMERCVGCHANCEAYKAYCQEMRKKRIFMMNMNGKKARSCSARWSKSSGRYVAPKSSIKHNKERCL